MRLFTCVVSSVFAFIMISLCGVPAQAVQLDQVDTFEDGTTQGWSVGQPHPVPPVNMSSGGPAGDEDNYLLMTAIGGDGPGSRLATFNTQQWAGDYLMAGIEAIRLDLNNLGDSDLHIRLLIADPAGGPPENAVATQAWFLPAGSGWTSCCFSILLEDLVTILGDPSLALAQATELRIFHGEEPVFPPEESISAQLGVDNIRSCGEPTDSGQATWGRMKRLYR